MDIEQIKGLIRDVPDFPEPGIVFKDITPVLADPIAFSTITDMIVVHFGRGNVDKVVGIEARGFIIACAGGLPLRRRVRADPQAGQAPVRRPSTRTTSSSTAPPPSRCTATRIEAGERVLIVDDVLATGGTAQAAASLVQQVGGNVCGIAHRDRARFPAWARAAGRTRAVHADPLLSGRASSSPYTGWRGGAVDSREDLRPEQETPARRAGRLPIPRPRLRRGEPTQPSLIDPVLKKVRGYNPKADVREIARAFAFAEASHEGQKRKSGEHFITHPVAVADSWWTSGSTRTTIQAALLHDTVEDTSVTLEGLEEEFGGEVARIVDGVTKIDRFEFRTREQEQAENFRKMLVAMAGDIRVILIKLADRLHNMRTLGAFEPEETQRRIAPETLEIYAPLAHRLGVAGASSGNSRTSRSRRSNPGPYREIAEPRRARRARARGPDRAGHVGRLAPSWRNSASKAEVEGRPKHLYPSTRRW